MENYVLENNVAQNANQNYTDMPIQTQSTHIEPGFVMAYE